MFHIIPQKIDISVQSKSTLCDVLSAAEAGLMGKKKKASLQQTEGRLYKMIPSYIPSITETLMA